MGSLSENRVALIVAGLAFIGAIGGTVIGGKIEKIHWESKVQYEQKQSILRTRIELIEKTTKILSMSGLASEYDRAIAAKVEQKLLNEAFEVKIKLIDLNAEYSTLMQMNHLFFGDKTKEVVGKFNSIDTWREVKPSVKSELLNAMYLELSLEI